MYTGCYSRFHIDENMTMYIFILPQQCTRSLELYGFNSNNLKIKFFKKIKIKIIFYFIVLLLYDIL